VLLPYKTLTETLQVCLGKTMLPGRHISRSSGEFLDDIAKCYALLLATQLHV